MTEAKHTPGPWEAHQGIFHTMPEAWDVTAKTDGWQNGEETPKGWFLATVHEVKDADRAAHDARLIAAAPELLELAHQYLSDLRYPPTGDSLERRIERAKAVIATATRLEAENER